MKKSELKQIIKEELNKVLNEDRTTEDSIQNMLNTMGFQVKVPKKLDQTYKKIATINIPRSSLGLMSSVFTKITCDVLVAKTTKGIGYIRLHYSWEHPRGSNGLQIESHQLIGGGWSKFTN